MRVILLARRKAKINYEPVAFNDLNTADEYMITYGTNVFKSKLTKVQGGFECSYDERGMKLTFNKFHVDEKHIKLCKVV